MSESVEKCQSYSVISLPVSIPNLCTNNYKKLVLVDVAVLSVHALAPKIT